MTEIYWIDGLSSAQLAIAARPRGGDWLGDDISNWKIAGIKVVVCLLEESEIAELDLKQEASICRNNDITIISFPIPDRGVPQPNRASELADQIATHMSEGRAVAIHCRAGIGRSSIVAACVLVRTGLDADVAFARIAQARRLQVPDTDEQKQWLQAFAENFGKPPSS